MSAGISIGSIEGELKLSDAFSAPSDKLTTIIARLSTSVDHLTDKLSKVGTRPSGAPKTTDDTLKLTAAYQKLSAQLDPAVAATQRYEKAEKVLDAALKASIITQAQHTAQLKLAHDKLQQSSQHTLTWRQEVGHLTEKISGLTNVLGPLSGASNEIIEGLSGAASKAGILGESIAALGPLAPVLIVVAAAAAGVAIAFEAAKVSVEFIAEAVKDGLKLQEIINGLNHTLESNGSASGLSAKQLVEYAESLELVIARSKEEIIPAEQILSRYDHLNKTTFPRLLRLTADYAQVQKEATGANVTMAEGARKLGPAFEGNAKSLASLKDLGIVFTEGQKKTLKAMIDIGDITKYQSTLFEILDQKIGGAAEKFANTLPGGIRRAHLSLDEFKEGIASELIPVFEDLMNDIVASFGGWKHFKEIVISVSHEVGNALRVIASSIIIFYHETIGTLEILTSAFLSAVSKVVKAASIVALATGQTEIFAKLSAASDKLATLSKNAALNALDHAKVINVVISRLKEHRLALEGDEKVYNKDGSAIDKVTQALSRQAKARESALTSLHDYEQELKLAADQAARLATVAVTGDPKLTEQEKNLIEIENALLREKEKLLKVGVDITNKQVQATLALIATHIHDRQESDKIAKLWNDVWESMKKISDLPLNLGEDRLADRTHRLSTMRIGPTAEDTAHAEEFFASIRHGLMTSRQLAEEENLRVQIAWKDSLKSAEDLATMEQYLSNIRESTIVQAVDDWQTLFSFMGSMFGGIFKELADGIARVQSAYGAGKKLDASGFGGSMAGSWGAIFAEVAIFYEAYVAVSNMIKRKRQHRFGDLTSLSVSDGEVSSPSYFNEAGRQASSYIRSLLDQIIQAMGAVLDDLPQIVIRARKDGKEFSAYVAGIFVGIFGDAQSAIDAAVASALTSASFASIGREFSIVLQHSIGASLDELQANIQLAVSARTARIGDVGEQYVELTTKTNAEIEAMRRVGLATDDRIRRLHQEQQAMIDNALGINTSSTQRLRDLASLSSGIGEAADSTRASLQRMIDDTMAAIARLQRQGPAGGDGGAGEGGFDGSGFGRSGGFTKEMDSELARLQAQLDEYIAQLDRIPQALSDDQINMGIKDTLLQYLQGNVKYAKMAHELAMEKLKAEFESLRLQLVTMGKWEEFATMWQDAFDSAASVLDKPSSAHGGGNRAQARESALAQLDQMRAAAVGSATEAVQQNVSALIEWKKQAKEARLTTAQYAEGVRLLNDQLARTLAEQSRQLNQSIDDFRGFVDPFAAISLQADKLRHDLADLANATGMSADDILDATRRINEGIDYQRQKAVFGIFDQIYSYLKDTPEYAAQILDFKKRELNVQFLMFESQLRAMNMWDEATAKIVSDAHAAGDALLKVVNAMLSPSEFAEAVARDKEMVGGEAADKLKKAQDLLASYQTDLLDDLTRNLRKINTDFDSIIAALGSTPDVIASKNAAISHAIDSFLEPVKSFRQQMDLSSATSTLTSEQQLRSVRDQFHAIVAGGRLEDRDKLLSLAATYRDLGRASRSGQGYRFIDADIKAALDSFIGGAPAAAAQMGSSSNPMAISAPTLQKAVETGNSAIVVRLDEQTRTMQSAALTLASIDAKVLNSGMSSRNVA